MTRTNCPQAIPEHADATPVSEYSDESASGSESQEDEHLDKSIAKGGVTTPFPWKLHDMLDAMDKEGKQSIVCWQPHGRAFMVLKPREFVDSIMNHYFNQTKYASFQRQLNLYGFSRLSHGRDKGAYYHKCFVRGERNLCRGMVRQKIKGTKVRRSLSPEEEPDFYAPQWKRRSSDASSSTSDQASSAKRKKEALVPKPVTSSSSPMYKPVALKPSTQPTQTSSLVSLVDPTRSSATVVPPASVFVKPIHPGQPSKVPSATSTPSTSIQSVRGGDLLFFEGRPFRYLEHLEELPPLPIQRAREPSYKESLHDMIHTIVKCKPSRIDPPNVCSV